MDEIEQSERLFRKLEMEQLMDMDIVSLAEVVQNPGAFFAPTSGRGSEVISNSKTAFFTLVTFLPRPELEGLENFLALTSPSLYLEIVGQEGQARIDAVQAQLDSLDDESTDAPTTKTIEELREELRLIEQEQRDIWQEHATIKPRDARSHRIIDPNSMRLPESILPIYLRLSDKADELRDEISCLELEASNRAKSKRQSLLINFLGLCLLVLAAYAAWKLL